jgi:hypothetical protein
MQPGPRPGLRSTAWKTDMKRRVPISHPRLQYEAFLFEPLGDDRNGAPLALASILGRMSLDPWNEAASLAALPADVAAEKLASLIEAIPNKLFSRPQSNTLADRLVKLLPAEPKPEQPESDSSVDAERKRSRPLVTYLIWLALACVLLAGVTFG